MNDKQIYTRTIAILITFLTIFTAGCVNEPANQNPTVSSMVAFPSPVQQSDSFLVVCNAADMDGDALTYDWSCGNYGASIQGAPTDNQYKLNGTRENMRVFYARDSVPCVTTPDTVLCGYHATIFCDVRDGKGGLKTVYIFVPITR